MPNLTSLLPIKLRDIQFGERDALHEFLKQDKQNLDILERSFVVPPRVDMEELEAGVKFLVVGPKGSGKTTLLWHLKRQATSARSKMILFKSDLRKEDRDRLDKMVDMIVVTDQKKIPYDYDYKTVWEWYLIKNVVGLITQDDIEDGHNLFNDICTLLDVKKGRLNTIYDNFHVEKVKGKINVGFKTGVLKSDLSAEIEARQENNLIDFLDLIRLIQSVIIKIKLKPSAVIRLYVDELEFFMSSDGDGQRDQRLVRDLVFAINSVNILFGTARTNIVVLASLRSEIFNTITANHQEIEKIVDAFGVKLDWYHEDADGHSVLGIFENKIRYSEINSVGEASDEVWGRYFPNQVEQKHIKNYLLDVGLHRPRGVLLRIKAALEVAKDTFAFSEDDFLKSEDAFGRYMLQEFSDDISAVLDEEDKDSLLALFRGYNFTFYLADLKSRRKDLADSGRGGSKKLSNMTPENIVRLLYRIGIIGNQFEIKNEFGRRSAREFWSFRGTPDPIFRERFVIHKSVRKTLQTI